MVTNFGQYVLGFAGCFLVVLGAGLQWGTPAALMASGAVLCLAQWEINA
jgi:hypothetical protein